MTPAERRRAIASSTDPAWLARQLGSAGLERAVHAGDEITLSWLRRFINWLRDW